MHARELGCSGSGSKGFLGRAANGWAPYVAGLLGGAMALDGVLLAQRPAGGLHSGPLHGVTHKPLLHLSSGAAGSSTTGFGCSC